MKKPDEISRDIGYAVTVTTGGYFSMELYVAVPADAADPETWAWNLAVVTLNRLAHVVPEARLEVTTIRRVN